MSKKPQNYMKKADAAFSKYIRARDGRCQACGATEFLQCAHIHSRSYRSIRTNELNALALCRSCHVKWTHRPLEWHDWVEEHYPGRWDELKTQALRFEKVDWKEQAEFWKAQL